MDIHEAVLKLDEKKLRAGLDAIIINKYSGSVSETDHATEIYHSKSPTMMALTERPDIYFLYRIDAHIRACPYMRKFAFFEENRPEERVQL